jgi:hypothetical protein
MLTQHPAPVPKCDYISIVALPATGDFRVRATEHAIERIEAPTNASTPSPFAREAVDAALARRERRPLAHTVNRASIDAKPQAPEIVIRHLMEGIGIALDVAGDRMFVTDFAGSVYSAKLDGSGERNFLYAQGNLTGIAYTEI